jgi:hypothetical protein
LSHPVFVRFFRQRKRRNQTIGQNLNLNSHST